MNSEWSDDCPAWLKKWGKDETEAVLRFCVQHQRESPELRYLPMEFDVPFPDGFVVRVRKEDGGGVKPQEALELYHYLKQAAQAWKETATT